MNTNQLEYLLKNRARHFVGVFASDEKPPLPKAPASMIFNTAPSNSSGEHWVAVNLGKKKKKGVRIEYFDPLGMEANPDIEDFLAKLGEKDYLYSTKPIQSHSSNICGIYTALYCFWRSKGVSFARFLSKYGSDVYENDCHALNESAIVFRRELKLKTDRKTLKKCYKYRALEAKGRQS